MRAITTALAAVAGITAVAAVMALSEKGSNCRNRAAFAVHQSVPPAKKVLRLPVGCRHHRRHRRLRRLRPRAYWVEETVSLEIPAPREAAYSVYTDLVRQPEWSPWLKSIEHDREKQTSKWVVQQRGVRISWSAVTTLEIPGLEVQWKSTTGLSNRGRVTFEDAGPARCLMTLTLSYNLPYVLAKLLRLDVVEKIVQRTLLSDLQRFVNVLSKQPEVIAATTAAQEVVRYELPALNDYTRAASGKSISGSTGELRTAPTEETAKMVPGNGGSETSPAVSPKATALAAATTASAAGTQETIAMAENDLEGRKHNDALEDYRYDAHDETVAATPGLRDSNSSSSVDLVELDEIAGDRGEGEKRKRWRQRLRRLFRRDRLDGAPTATVGVREAVADQSEDSSGGQR